jgi:hypothetical protein
MEAAEMKKLLSACLVLVLLLYCVTAAALVGGQGFGSYNTNSTAQSSIIQMDLTFPSTEPESVTVKYNDTEYSVSLVSVGLNIEGKRTVNLYGLGTSLPTRKGEKIAHIQAEIEANGFTYEWDRLQINGLGVATFLFNTSAYPEKVLVYSYDNKKRKTLTLDAEDVAEAAAEEFARSPVRISDDYKYTVDENGKATITKHSFSDTSVSVPSSLDGYPVIGIGDSAFLWDTFLTTVKLPSGIQTIGSMAFCGCSALKSISMPAKLKFIGSSAFYGCPLIESIYVPDNVEYIGTSAFEGCRALKSINVSSGNRVYYGKSGVLFHKKDKELVAYPAGKKTTDYSVPQGILSIAACAFAECKGLTSVGLPDGLQTIGNMAFYHCYWLESVSLPDGLQSIGSQAFYDCRQLVSVSLPDSLVSIGDQVFYNCSSLESIEVAAENPVYAAIDGALINKDDHTLLVYPAGRTETKYSVPQYIEVLSANAFQNCTSLTTVNLPDGLADIEHGAFYGCTSLTSISLPDSLRDIGSDAFHGCTLLTSVKLPEGLTKLESSVFNSCTSLTSIVLPDSLQSIGNFVFQNCSALTSVDILDGLQSIDTDAFGDCTSLTTLSLPASVRSISDSAFEGCSSLTLIVPQGSYVQEYAEKNGIPYQLAD